MHLQLRLFLTAIMFYTRLPVPSSIGHSDAQLRQATRYFPLVGWIAGAVCGLVLAAGILLLTIPHGTEIAVLLSMAAGVLLTGALHEDGFADACDGFGGGYTPERVLTIMKDSRIGTYGTLGLLFIMTLKFFLLLSLVESLFSLTPLMPTFRERPLALIILALVSAHALSRFAAAMYVVSLDYVQDIDQSKAKPIAQGRLSIPEILIAATFGVLPLVLFSSWSVFLVLPVLLAAWMLLGSWFKMRIGGYTGDCLGAAQQIFEILVYAGLLVIWRL